MSAGAPLADEQPLRVGSNWDQMRTYLLRLATAGSPMATTGEKFTPLLDPEMGMNEKHGHAHNFGDDSEGDATRKPKNKNKKSRTKRRLVLLAAVAVLGYHFVPRLCHRHGHKDLSVPSLATAWEKVSGDWRNEPPSKAKFTSAQYNSPVFFDQSSGLVRQSANATIPIGNKGINVQFIRVPGRVVVSRAAEAALIVESQWSGDGKFGANVNFMNDNRNTFVSISTRDDSYSSHTLHIILPPGKQVPPLRVSKASLLEIAVHPSANDVVGFDDLTVIAHQLRLPNAVFGDAVLATEGDITGLFNVSRSLQLITKTGAINATVHAVRPLPDDKHPKPPKHDESEHEARHWRHAQHPHPPPPPPGHRHRGPPPVNVLAVASKSVELHIHKPHFVGANTAARSETGKVSVFALPTFHGGFIAGTDNGDVKVKAGPKKVHIVHEKITDSGKFVKGFVEPPHHPHHPHHPPHKGPKEPKKPKNPEDVEEPEHDDEHEHDDDDDDKHEHEKRMWGGKHKHHHHHHDDHGHEPHHPPHPLSILHRRPHGPPGASRIAAFARTGDVLLVL